MGIPHYKDPEYGKLWARANPTVERLTEPRPMFMQSKIVRQADMDTPDFAYWIRELQEPVGYCRKQWEDFFILQTLWQLGMLQQDKRGLGFGVGREPLVTYFAKHGCQVLATDIQLTDQMRKDWVDTHQHIENASELNERKLVTDAVFRDRVDYREVNMNNIPADLNGQFDFTWSANSLDHCGSIALGLKFIRNSLDCLKPGGVAVHTTEFNCLSNTRTLESGGTVFFRARDLEDLFENLKKEGFKPVDLNLRPGTKPLDSKADRPPYVNEPHLRLVNSGFFVTSVGLIIVK